MTPPISPATLVHRGSVINQGPMAGRALMSTPSLGAMAQPGPCSSYADTLYHCSSYSSLNYQPALRSPHSH